MGFWNKAIVLSFLSGCCLAFCPADDGSNVYATGDNGNCFRPVEGADRATLFANGCEADETLLDGDDSDNHNIDLFVEAALAIPTQFIWTGGSPYTPTGANKPTGYSFEGSNPLTNVVFKNKYPCLSYKKMRHVKGGTPGAFRREPCSKDYPMVCIKHHTGRASMNWAEDTSFDFDFASGNFNACPVDPNADLPGWCESDCETNFSTQRCPSGSMSYDRWEDNAPLPETLTYFNHPNNSSVSLLFVDDRYNGYGFNADGIDLKVTLLDSSDNVVRVVTPPAHTIGVHGRMWYVGCLFPYTGEFHEIGQFNTAEEPRKVDWAAFAPCFAN